MAPNYLVAPATLEEAGLSLDLVNQLVLKTLCFSGELSGSDLAKRLGVHFGVIEPVLEFLKSQRHCEVVGGSIAGGSSYRYRITSDGRSVAALYLQQSLYTGVAPVPLEQYRKYLAGLRDAGTVAVTRDDVYKGFAHLVVAPAALDEIGPALNSGHSILLYGPSGNGKTVIAHALRDLLAGDILVPYALEVEGSIIRVFDPVSHEARPPLDDDGGQFGLSSAPTRDRRWVVCRRPMVKAGAELTLESLELSFDRRLGYYRAPLQLIANGGMILVDDFGRQRCSPRDLLNRWLVPLESGTEYLTLQSGMTFEVPFLALTVFATNIAPSELLDEAFLRRVRHKVLVAGPSIGGFIRIFENCCRERDVAFDRAVVEGLLDGYFRTHNVTLRGCQPRDLIDHALLLAEYRGAPRELTVELLETACAAYFVENRA